MGDRNAEFTVDEALVAMGFGKFQGLVLAYAGMGWVGESMEMILLSFVGPAVQAEWGLSSRQDSLITSVVFAGMLVGAYAWGIVSDNFGRRKGFFITAIITCVAGFLSAFAPNYSTLIIFRCLVGLGLGGGPVLSSWYLEFIPAPDRGTWMVVFSAFWTLGTVLEASLAWLVMPKLGWRWLLALSSLPSFVLLLFYGSAPESPRYLCLKGRMTEALGVLNQIAKLNRTKLLPGMLVIEHKLELDESSTLLEDTHLLSPEAEQNETKIMNSNNESAYSLFMLFSPKLVRSTLLLWLVYFGYAFSYYGLVLLTTELTSSHNDQCGPTAIPPESPKNTISYRDVFIASFAEFPGLLLSAVAVDRAGRKLSMSAMFFICCICLLPLLYKQSEGLTTSLLFGARICITGAMTVAYIYAPEVYPTSVRTTGVGVASAMGRIGGILCPFVAVGLVQGCHQTASILLFEIIILLSGIAVLFLPYETKGCELNDNVSKLKQDKPIV